MSKAIRYIFIVVIICLQAAAYAQSNSQDTIVNPTDDELLASQYYQNKEYDKAAVLYGKLYTKNQSPFYYNNYLNCLLELKDFSNAEKIVKKRVKKYPDGIKYRVDLGYVYIREQQKDKADREFEDIIKDLKGEYQETVDVANAFLIRSLTDYAIKTYDKSRKIFRDNNIFNLELADIYDKMGDYQNMTEEYLNLAESNRSILEQVENRLQITLNNDISNKKNEILRRTLIKRIQQNPNNTIYSELMLWHAIQRKDFESALQQAKILDRLYKEAGDRIFNLAKLCTTNEDYQVAEQAYEYLINKGETNIYYTYSIVELLNVKYLKLQHSLSYNTDDVIALEKSFISAINNNGRNDRTISLIENLANIQSYYLSKYKDAIDLLKDAIKLQSISKEDRAKCKTELGDILMMSGDVWEATLLYSQVEKEFKYDTIGYSAKFKNAKLFYYIGEFKWASAQLDILKAATSKLIANDAMDLFLLINDNVDLTDSTRESEAPLRMYARADLYTFQNKNDEALQTLDSIFIKFPEQTVCDRVYYKKAEIKIRKGIFEEADSLLGTLILKYPYSVLIDDAIFKKAEISQYQFKNIDKAMKLYEKLLKNYPGSVYATEARKRFRQLRGDQIN